MKSTILSMTLAGALAFGGMMTFGATTASAACLGIGGAYICAPVARHKHWRRHNPDVVIEFGRSYPRYHKKRHFRRHRDFYDDHYYRPHRYYGRYDPYWDPRWGDPADHWR